MKILVVGSDINAVLLAKYLKLQDEKSDIYIIGIESEDDSSYTIVDIRENDIHSICDFVKYNQIEFTVVTSQIAIINGIADIFRQEGFPIFAPLSEAARVTFFNSIAKKIMYKLKINTPKFGIFDRENIAIDYVRHSKFPIIVKNDFIVTNRETYLYKNFKEAKLGLQTVFEKNNEKIVIENYIESKPLYIYFIADGFNALPLIALERENNIDYTIISAPSEKLGENMLIKILQNAIYPLLDDISKYADNYTGIIGLKIKLQKENFYVLEFYNGFQSYDFQVFLSILEDNLLTILFDAANGCLADNHDYVNLNNKFSYTVSLKKSEIEQYDFSEDYIESEDDNNITITNTSLTFNNAKDKLLQSIEAFCNEKTYEKVIEFEKKRECRI